jgi:hypothetical protein
MEIKRWKGFYSPSHISAQALKGYKFLGQVVRHWHIHLLAYLITFSRSIFNFQLLAGNL